MPAGKTEKGEKSYSFRQAWPWIAMQLAHYRRLSTPTHSHTHVLPSLQSPSFKQPDLLWLSSLICALPQIPAQSLVGELRRVIKVKMTPICLYCAKRYSAIMPEKGIILIPGQSLLWDLLSSCETKQCFHDLQMSCAKFGVDQRVQYMVFKCLRCHFCLVEVRRLKT